jgi:hypothetical protein
MTVFVFNLYVKYVKIFSISKAKLKTRVYFAFIKVKR